MEFIHGLDTPEKVQALRDDIMAQISKLYITTSKTVEGNAWIKSKVIDLEKVKNDCDTFLLQEILGQPDTSVVRPYYIR